MKRLFALIGLTYLSALAVVFYFYSSVLICVVLCAVFVVTAAALMLKIKRNTKFSILIANAAVLCACASYIVFSNLVFLPTLNNYSGKEININGYVCEEVQKNTKSFVYTVQTNTVNGKNEKLIISVVSYSDLQLDAFDKIDCTMKTEKSDSNYLLSKKIYLQAFANDNFTVKKLGKKQITPYYYAVNIRKVMKESLNSLLPEKYSSLCRAVLLGDKNALSSDVKSNFSDTGTSFLIVVSGMHLSIVTMFLLLLLKIITKNRIVQCVFACMTVTAFMALTGFTSSVMRSGIMVIITCCAPVVLRRADSLNSLGAAALILTLTNPFSVGDIGMLLSFSATAGIILWSKPINDFIVKKLCIKRKSLKIVAGYCSASVSASLWVLPFSVLAFGRLSPFTIIVSVLAEPFVCALIVCSLLYALLFLVPFFSFCAYPFALAAGLLCKYILWLENLFASIPFCTINTEKPYFYIWVIVTAVLCVVGFLIKRRKEYIKCCAVVSAVVLVAGWAFFTVAEIKSPVLTVCNAGTGVSAFVKNGESATFISCGGSASLQSDFMKYLDKNLVRTDCVIIPKQNNYYARHMIPITEEFDVSNVLVYDNGNKNNEKFYASEFKNFNVINDNTHFKLNVASNVTNEVLCRNGVMYQLVKSASASILFIPSSGNADDLPNSFTKADYLLTDGKIKNANRLYCKHIIFSGSNSDYGNYVNSLKEISDDIIKTSDGNISVSLSDGGYNAENY